MFLNLVLKVWKEKKIYYDLVVILGNSYPFRSEDLIDKMIKKLLEEGSDTLIAAIKESRGIWLSESNNNKIDLINDPTTPRNLKKTRVYNFIRACCVTHPSNLREKNI